MDVSLNEEDFKTLCGALRAMHAHGRRLEARAKRAKLEIAQVEVEAQEASSQMREVLDPLADKYGFDPDVPYELNYETKSLVRKKT